MPATTVQCMDLLALLAGSHRDLRTALGQQGGIHALVAIVLQRPPTLSQRHALAALVALATNHPDNKRRMVDVNMLPVAILLLQESAWDGVRGQAAALLLQLACDSAVLKERIVDARGVPALLSCLSVSEPPSSGVTQTNAAAALRSLALSEHARHAIVAANGLQQLMGALQRGNSDCQATVADVVGMVATSGADVQAVVQPLVMLLQSPNDACRRAAAAALRAWACCSADAQLVVGAGARAVVTQRLRSVGPHDVEELSVLKQLAACL